MMSTVICYRTKEPEIYSEGTKWEKREFDFLAYYTYKTIEEAQKEVNKLNQMKPEQLWNGRKIDWNKIDYFYVEKQEEMCD